MSKESRHRARAIVQTRENNEILRKTLADLEAKGFRCEHVALKDTTECVACDRGGGSYAPTLFTWEERRLGRERVAYWSCLLMCVECRGDARTREKVFLSIQITVDTQRRQQENERRFPAIMATPNERPS